MTDSAEIARLKAEAAQAAADAAAAKAAAAQAALDAALSASSAGSASDAPATTPATAPAESTGTSPAAPHAASAAATPEQKPEPAVEQPPGDQPAAEKPAAEAPAAGQPAPAAPSAYAEQVRQGYSFSTTTLPVGTYLDTQVEGDPTPVAGLSVGIPLGLLNRHALVAGATGTGKTRTLQLLAEGLSAAGVPVFLSDIKGDLTGLAEPGPTSDRLTARTTATGQQWAPQSFPLELFTLGGASPASQGGAIKGTPIRTTVTEFGPILLGRVLGLNDTQSSALQLVFHWADAQGLALLDLKDLRSVVDYLTNSEAGKAELKT